MNENNIEEWGEEASEKRFRAKWMQNEKNKVKCGLWMNECVLWEGEGDFHMFAY